MNLKIYKKMKKLIYSAVRNGFGAQLFHRLYASRIGR